jgi:hypothetical protein
MSYGATIGLALKPSMGIYHEFFIFWGYSIGFISAYLFAKRNQRISDEKVIMDSL